MCDFVVPPSLDLSSPLAFSVGLESAFDALDSLSFAGVLPVQNPRQSQKLSCKYQSNKNKITITKVAHMG